MPDITDLLLTVVDRGASDLHLTVGLPPVVRLHGALHKLDGAPLSSADTRELVYAVMPGEVRQTLEQDWEVDFAYSLPGHARFRVNAYMQRGSAGAAFRLIPASIRSIPDLGLPLVLRDLARRPRGLVMITGPTGSGKSTTLASMIDHINDNDAVHIVTVEDPIEYLHEHRVAMVNQREVGSDTRSFGAALRQILRQDPDVILIGELRDLETMSAALTAAETGHLVLATLHTQGATQTVDRIIDVFPPYQQQQVRVQLAGTLQGVVSQQLLPTADGRGRVVACEVLIPTPGVRNLIREGKTHQLDTAMQTGTQHGMTTMDHALALLCERGMITVETARQRSVDPDTMAGYLSGRR